MNYPSKLPSVGESIFATMTGLAVKHNAINLSQGFPDFNCDENLRNLVMQQMTEGRNQYAPMPGLLSLRQKIADKIGLTYNIKINPENEITIHAGATQALYTAISSFCVPGSEVLFFEPAYDSYLPSILAAGGIPVPLKLRLPDFSVDWDEFASKLSDKTSMVIINTPHNPTGTVLESNELETLAGIIDGRKIVVLSDEVYEHIIFDEHRHSSLLEFRDRIPYAISIFSFGKVYHTTGWKVGYSVATPELTAEIRKLHQFVVFAVNTPVQHAYSQFLANREYYLGLPSFFEKKRDFIIENLKESRFIPKPISSGTYFQLLDYSAISDKNDLEFARLLTVEFGIALIPLSPFYSDSQSSNLLRLCFAKKDETLEAGIQKLLYAEKVLLNK